MGESANPTLTLRFDSRLRLEFRGAAITSTVDGDGHHIPEREPHRPQYSAPTGALAQTVGLSPIVAATAAARMSSIPTTTCQRYSQTQGLHQARAIHSPPGPSPDPFLHVLPFDP